MRNLNEVLRKDVTYDNIKRHKKPGLDPLSFSLSLCLSVRYIFGKTTGDGSN